MTSPAQIPGSLSQSRLESLLESAKLLNSNLNIVELLGHLLRTVMGRYLIMRGVVAIRHGETSTVQVSRGCAALKKDALFTVEAAQAAGLELVFEIGGEGEHVGTLALGKPARGPLDAEETDFVRALLGLAASVIANALSHGQSVLLNRELDQKVQELRALLDLVRGLAATLDPEEVAKLLLLTFSGRWAVTKSGVVAWKEGQPTVLKQRGLRLEKLEEQREVVQSLPDASVLQPDQAAALGLPDGSLVIPIRSAGETSGAVVCGPRILGAAYNRDDLEFGAVWSPRPPLRWTTRGTSAKPSARSRWRKNSPSQQTSKPSSFPRSSPPCTPRTWRPATGRRSRWAENLSMIREFVNGIGMRAGFPPAEVAKLELAVDEACANVIEHAYGPEVTKEVSVRATLDEESVEIEIVDTGKGFDPSLVSQQNLDQMVADRRSGGLGMRLMKTLMDEVHYQMIPGQKNELRMIKRLKKKGQA